GPWSTAGTTRVGMSTHDPTGRIEVYMDRIKIPKAAADLLAYCDAHIGEDPLIMPVLASENPFREKKLFVSSFDSICN
uniref:Guanine nucleotide-binding protein subunit gamma n=1 Tax=Crocodylus porosus TaxID=8502 RepID=A0A7M4EID8_CROPO